MSDREQVEVEARWRYSRDEWGDDLSPFIAGRTVNAEQVEAAAEAGRGVIGGDPSLMAGWWELSENSREGYRDVARAAFRAAGLLIEGDDDA